MSITFPKLLWFKFFPWLFQAWKWPFYNSMTFPGFRWPYGPCKELKCETCDPTCMNASQSTCLGPVFWIIHLRERHRSEFIDVSERDAGNVQRADHVHPPRDEEGSNPIGWSTGPIERRNNQNTLVVLKMSSFKICCRLLWHNFKCGLRGRESKVQYKDIHLQQAAAPQFNLLCFSCSSEVVNSGAAWLRSTLSDNVAEASTLHRTHSSLSLSPLLSPSSRSSASSLSAASLIQPLSLPTADYTVRTILALRVSNVSLSQAAEGHRGLKIWIWPPTTGVNVPSATPTSRRPSPWRCRPGWGTARSWASRRSCRRRRTTARWSSPRRSSWWSRSRRPRRNTLGTQDGTVGIWRHSWCHCCVHEDAQWLEDQWKKARVHREHARL